MVNKGKKDNKVVIFELNLFQGNNPELTSKPSIKKSKNVLKKRNSKKAWK